MDTFMMGSTPRWMSLHRFFPVLPIKAGGADLVEVHAVETAYVDVDLLGIGARYVEGMNPAVPAKTMLRHAGVESVGRKLIRSRQQLEALAGHDQVQDPLLRADRAVALAHAVEARGHPKAYPAAVAAAFVAGHCRP